MTWARHILVLILVLGCSHRVWAVRYAGSESRLSISRVGDRCIRIRIEPVSRLLGDRQVTSTVLVPFEQEGLLDVNQLADERSISVGRLQVKVWPSAGLGISIRTDQGRPVQELTFSDDPNGIVRFRIDAMVLGLGEGARQFDRRGALYPMEASWGGWDRPTLGSVIPSPFLIGTDGWGMFVHQPLGRFDLRANPASFVPLSQARGSLDIFVIALQEPADAVSHYVLLTGRPAMPPKWALGYLQSHRTLAGPDEVLAVARTFRQKGLPCDGLIYLGTGYCPSGWNTGHGSTSFNPKTFDRPQDIIGLLHQMGFKVILHVNRPPQDLFGDSILQRSEDPSHIANYWGRHRQTFAMGVDGWWPDDGDELSAESRLARHRCYYLGPLEDRPGQRPWSLHRTGYAGCQRYGGWIWSGDIDSTWRTLAAQVAVGLNHSLSLTPFWGTDTGGFYPTSELTGELYVRWFQFSAFCPLFRSHGRTWHLRLPWGWNTGSFGPIEHNRGPDESELHNGDVEPICRRYLELRYRLLPYNYTVARQACDTGMPMMRAMWLHFPKDPNATMLADQYMWGPNLLIAPVLQKDARSRRLYLPDGLWYDWWTGQRLEGGRWIERPVDLATMPIYARAGSIIPLDPVRQYVDQPVDGPTILRIFPSADGGLVLYDDDGTSTGYQQGSDPKAASLELQWDDHARRLRIGPGPQMGRWTQGRRLFQAELVGGHRQAAAEFDGSPIWVQL